MAQATTITISMAIMLVVGFLATRVVKLLHLPNVTAYIVAGIIIGPYFLDLIPKEFVQGSDFLPDVAVCFIAFSVGEFFELQTLKKNGIKVFVITFFEAMMASVLVFGVTFFILKLGSTFSIMLSALAAATAPASTLMTIRQTKAKGEFVDTLLQVVALDDVISLIAYSIAISIALGNISQNASSFEVIAKPLLMNLLALIFGAAFGILLHLFMLKKHSTDNRLIIALSVLFSFCAICSYLGVSPLLGCMVIGMTYINISKDDKLFKQLNYFSPPILLLFFVRSGMNFDLNALVSSEGGVNGFSLMQIGGIYFVVRIIGKYFGAFLGAAITKKPANIRNYIGLALIPQASVAIGLAAMCARVLGEGIGTDMQTIILFSSVLYELIGPACGKLSLYLSKSYGANVENVENVEAIEKQQEVTPIEELIRQIELIQKELPERDNEISPEEAAFDEALEEQEYVNINRNQRVGMIFRK